MAKEFIEYQSESGTIPYTASKLCFCLTRYAQDYISEQNNNNVSKIDPKVRDAVITDAINFLGRQGGIDFALHTRDLYGKRDNPLEVDSQCLLTAVVNHFAFYIFNEGIVESVLRNRHMNRCNEPFDVNDGVAVLIDYINYISKRNDYAKRYTAEELYNKVQKLNHNIEMADLKDFLERTSKYGERLTNGENIDDLYDEMANEYRLKYVSKSGVYYYTDDTKKQVGQSRMFPWDKYYAEREIYAMAYAYEKTDLKPKEKPETEIIRRKIKEMKKR